MFEKIKSIMNEEKKIPFWLYMKAALFGYLLGLTTCGLMTSSL